MSHHHQMMMQHYMHNTARINKESSVSENQTKLPCADILQELAVERQRQDQLWGTKFDDKNTVNDWASYVNYYVSRGAYDGQNHEVSNDKARACFLKAAAILVAAIEALDRNGQFALRHYDRSVDAQVTDDKAGN